MHDKLSFVDDARVFINITKIFNSLPILYYFFFYIYTLLFIDVGIVRVQEPI